MSRMSGADADALDQMGVRLEHAGARLRNLGNRLQRGLNSAPWQGRSADRFRHEFNTMHARSIAEAAQFLDDAYETLRRNADEQRRASDLAPRSWIDRIRLELQRTGYWVERFPWVKHLPVALSVGLWPHTFPALFGWMVGNRVQLPWRPSFALPDIRSIKPPEWLDDVAVGLVVGGLPGAIAGYLRGSAPEQPSATPAPAPQPAAPKGGGASETASPPSFARPGASEGTLREVISTKVAQAIHDRYRPGLPREYQYQCVAWAQARWLELGATRVEPGHGYNLAANNGGSTSTPPTLGAMASYGSADNFGHVMIVEEIAKGPGGELRIRVSEMNTGLDGSSADVGNPEEYREDRWWTRQPDGRWVRHPDPNGPQAITFASLAGR